MQQICLSLVHGTPELPAPLGELSPWVDWLIEPEAALFSGWTPSRDGGWSRPTPRSTVW